MTDKKVKVAITGAAGHIGYSLLFRIANGDVFGKDTEVSLHLLELESALRSLEGTVMELMDCAFPRLKEVKIFSDVNQAMDGVNWAVLVGSVPRKAGMERSDLLKINGAVFTAQGKAINDHAASDVRVFVVGNPCNTNCLIAMHNAPDVPRNRFYAMTMLDQNRATAQVAAKAGVAVSEVDNMIVWGNHSSTMYPDIYHTRIGGKSAMEVIQDEAWVEEFISCVQQRGAAIINARGASSAASAAQGVIDGMWHLVNETPAGKAFSMATCSQGEYDVEPGLIFSFPCMTVNGNIKVVTGWEHNAFAQARIKQTLEELRQEREMVKEMGLIGRS